MMSLEVYPYPSRRSAVLACNGVVATSQPLAAQAGLRALQNGGNAVDAAIATAVALTVLEPTSNGIGSDAFALVWDGQKLHGLNGSGRWPRSLSADDLRDQGHGEMPERGWLGVTVPGAPAAWQELNERFGRLALDELMAPAIAYAEEGFPVSPVIAQLWRNAADVFLEHTDPALSGWRQVFAPDGSVPRAGERWRSPGHARGLRLLASRGVRDFYDGEVASQILAFARNTGGYLDEDDLAAHRSEWVDPISISYRDYEVWEIPPNGQGIAALIALKLLEGTDAAAYPHTSEAAWHRQIEAMKLAFADTYRYVADPEHVPIPVTDLLNPAYIEARRALITERARLPEAGTPGQGGTVYLCTADRDGMMVSYIQSNFMGFGSGVVIPEVGVSLQNRGVGFTLEPGHPNEAAGGKRPRHTIIPGFLTRDGKPEGPFGVMGADMQPQGHVQVVTGMIDHDLNPQATLDAPRWQITDELGVLLEPGASNEMVDALAARGHQVTIAEDAFGFGRGQIIRRMKDGVYVAGSEPRTDGAALGW